VVTAREKRLESGVRGAKRKDLWKDHAKHATKDEKSWGAPWGNKTEAEQERKSPAKV